MKILLIGSGGREHALAWKLAQSPKCETLFCAPGNAGIKDVAQCVDISADNHEEILNFCKKESIDFVVVGAEPPLVEGIGSLLREHNIKVFGPNKEAAELEGSKGFMKDFCARHDIPTAAYARFKSAQKAKEYIATQSAPVVLKTDGLAAGKGVIIAQTIDEAQQTIDDMMSGEAFGSAGTEIVIEEFMEGEELSYFALADGNNYLGVASAQDHKRVGDGDTGPNTGGMGAYSPALFMDKVLEQKILDKIIAPTVAGMKKDGMPFQGVLFAGLMIENGEPRLIEYNKEGTLDQLDTVKFSNQTALCVVMAANGYPGSYEKGTPINGTEKINDIDDCLLFHAGTMIDNSNTLVATGGRVLGVVGLGDDVATAQTKAYEGVDAINWPEGFCRKDIGWREIERQKDKAA